MHQFNIIALGASLDANANCKSVELDLSIVMPLHNSASTLPLLTERFVKVLKPITQSYEIILVDDVSLDDSWLAIQTLSKSYASHMFAVQLMRNYFVKSKAARYVGELTHVAF